MQGMDRTMSTGRFCSICGSWHTERGPRCATHAAADQHARMQRQARDGVNTTAWQRTRSLVLERDGQHCTACGQPPRASDPLTVHRIGGGYHDTNLDAYRTLHRSCHGRIHALAQARRTIA